MFKQFVVVALLLAVVFGSIFGWKAYQGNQMAARMAAAKPKAVTVSSALAQTESWPKRVNAVGSLQAIQGVEVSPEVPGVIAEISFESGMHIEAGSILLQLDATAEQAELRSLEAQLVLAQQDYDRAKGLEVKTVLSQAQLDRAKSVLDSLAAQAEEQQALIDRKTIRAPFSGQLGIREISLGEYLSPGTPIVTLQQLDPIFVNFSVPERFLSVLQLKQIVELDLAAYPDVDFQGTVSAISPKVESRTRNIALQATLENPEGRLRPGMFTRTSVLLGGSSDVITLPRTSVNFLPYGDSIFIIENDGDALTVRRKQVTTGRVQGNSVEILEGTEPGQQVVRTGQLKLRNGQLIRIDNSIELSGGATEG
ncbi:MAG: efflux RND transporter periplasmic adaptor subunit [Gammaproteobacteria bacterium]|nr:efflux RND transporter periplasmic adaptor subunit [Gammaproteobacteria bacterium]MBT4492773.1 efflux RND transporter periplasmic adaptor subunit [Gammaproteobacteria bacterium]MBT7370360.1 efflux RND transporter periplasmic adaptor subunit [Gammaproteobacteria bacterium]